MGRLLLIKHQHVSQCVVSWWKPQYFVLAGVSGHALPPCKCQHDTEKALCNLQLQVIQYCQVSKNGLPKNGQAGILPKNKNVPGWNEELHVPDYALPYYVHARVCLYARASAQRKIRTKTAGSPENKNAPVWSHGPPFLETRQYCSCWSASSWLSPPTGLCTTE